MRPVAAECPIAYASTAEGSAVLWEMGDGGETASRQEVLRPSGSEVGRAAGWDRATGASGGKIPRVVAGDAGEAYQFRSPHSCHSAGQHLRLPQANDRCDEPFLNAF